MADDKLMLALVGLPTSGKTRLGRLLEGAGFHFLPEVAEVLRSKGLTAGERASPEFDRKVMSLEFIRDYHFIRSNRKVQLVETWHLGNIAYALARSSPIALLYKSKFQHTVRRFEVRCLELNVNPHVSYLRSLQSQKSTFNSIAFLTRVQEYMTTLVQEFGLGSASIDATQNFGDMAREATKIIQSWVEDYA